MANKTLEKNPYQKDLDKHLAACNQSRVLSEFYDWLSEKGIVLAHWYNDTQLAPIQKGAQQLFAEFFEIDMDRVEKGRRWILEHLET